MATSLLQFETHHGVRLRRQPGARASVPDQVLGERLLKDALVREQKRADRFDRPFTVLHVDRRNNSAGGTPWPPILSALALVKRDVDIIGWLKYDRTLALLMHDAAPQSALEVVQRLRGEISRRSGESDPAAVAIRLYAHCSQSGLQTAVRPLDDLVQAFVERRGYNMAKRVFDVIVSLALLALFAPVLLALFIFVKLTSSGPALFRQVRVGTWGQPFTMLKFRTMYVNAGHAVHEDYVKWFIKSSGDQPRTGNEVFKLTNDPRVTPAGRFLRRTSLDELPQLWNVLRGDMSLVGPRPGLPFELELYQAWHHRRMFEAKPGVTGPWQVFGRSRTTFDEMVRLDLRYARTRSLWTDIKILAATPAAMISGKGAC